MRKLLIAVLLLSAAALAQDPSAIGGSQGAQQVFNGFLYANAFGTWSVPQGDVGQFTWSNPHVCENPTGVTFNLFSVGLPIKIIDADVTKNETTTITAVSKTGFQCSIVTAPLTFPHFSFRIVSGTLGLQEALNYAIQRNLNTTVFLTNAWTMMGGTTGMITSAVGNANIGVADERSPLHKAYAWNGSAYIQQGLGGFGITNIDGVPIGQSVAAAGSFTTLNANGAESHSGSESHSGPETLTNTLTGSGDNPLVWGGSLNAARIFGWRDITSSKFGGVGDGVTSNVAAFNAACTDAFAVGAPVYIPPGNFSVPTTPASCVGNNMKFIGAGKVATTITLGAGAYLVDDPNGWVSFEMRDLKFEGGAGAVRNRFSGANVNGQYEIFGCYFHNFTGAAISNNSSDMPYWKIYENIFQAANTTTSIGVALSGLSDTSWIESNAFINYAIGVKLFGGGNNVHIDANEFLEFSAGTNRAAIWLVPQTSYSNAGYGMTISHNKFGVENLDATDKRVLYADESTGTFFGDRLYKTTASTGFIAGNRFHDNAVNGGPAGGTPFIYTYTPNLSGNNYGAVFSGGTPVNYMLQYDASILPLTNDTLDANNIIGPIVLADTAGVSAYNFTKVTNAVGAGWIQDTQGDLSFNDSTEPSPLITATGQASFTNLQTGGIGSYGTQAGVTFGLATDSVGGTDAIEATWTANAGVLKTFTTLPIAGVPIWVDFELQAGSSSPLATFNLEIFDVTNNKIAWQRLINLPAAGAGWKRYRLRWVPRNVPAGNFNLIFSNNSSNFGSGATGKIDVGRVVVYQSFEPLGGNQFMGTETHTGQIVSSLATGTAPLSIASTTPVANLTASKHPTTSYCGTTTTCANTAETAVRMVTGKVALTTGAATIGSITAFSGTANMFCRAQDETTPANAASCVPASTSSLTLGGTGSDTISYTVIGW